MDKIVAVITGTNSNLGLNIAYRLLDTLPSEKPVTIVVTSRLLPRVNEVIEKIKQYNTNVSKRTGLLEFDYILVDFTNMVSILGAYYELSQKFDYINYLYINAAQGVYSGIDWIQATKDVLTNPLDAVTNPTYKIQRVGVKSKDGMGLVFQANVFGPYYFIHKLIGMLSKGRGRIIWISSIMSDSKYLTMDDIQLLKSDATYEGSKRIVDLLHLASYKRLENEYNITQYLVHPGIFTSFSFFQFLNVFTYYGMMILFYFARFLGSPWHNVSGYKSANSVIFASVVADPSKNPQELKYGSATTRSGAEYLKTSEIADAQDAEKLREYFDGLVQKYDELLKDQILE